MYINIGNTILSWTCDKVGVGGDFSSWGWGWGWGWEAYFRLFFLPH